MYPVTRKSGTLDEGVRLIIMYLKLVTSSIIIGCSTFIGFEFAKKHVLRTRQLRELQGALSRLESEILHYMTPLPEALVRIGTTMDGVIGDLFCSTGQMLSEKRNMITSQAWRNTLDRLKDQLSLNEEEYDILYRFGDQLGGSYGQGQSKYIGLTLTQLYQQEIKAQECRQKYERMYKSLGLLGGIALAVLLL